MVRKMENNLEKIVFNNYGIIIKTISVLNKGVKMNNWFYLQ